MMSSRALTAATLTLAAVSALAACGSTSPQSTAGDSESVRVSAAFYPLAYAVERVGGDRVTVTNLTSPGVDPHDLELTPKQVAGLHRDDLVVVEKDFQPAVDSAIAALPREKVLDIAGAVDLAINAAPEDDHGDHADHHHGGMDPHFWLDPQRYAESVRAISARLATTDPAGATAYRANAAAFIGELDHLDADFTAGLTTCAVRELVTGHTSFGYLADRYDLHQEGIAGLSPDLEPSGSTMKAIVEHIREHDVTTVYTEPLTSPRITETIAREAGVKVAVLDPLEGLTDASSGSDYLEVMRANLATLRAGQGCR